MSSILKFDHNLIVKSEYVELGDLLPHEEIIESKLQNTLEFLNFEGLDAIIPTVLVCSSTNIIIDGHHRYNAACKLGLTKIPVTKILYSSNLISTTLDKNYIKKETIISRARNGDLFEPKSTAHRVKNSIGRHLPVVVLAELAPLRKL